MILFALVSSLMQALVLASRPAGDSPSVLVPHAYLAEIEEGQLFETHATKGIGGQASVLLKAVVEIKTIPGSEGLIGTADIEFHVSIALVRPGGVRVVRADTVCANEKFSFVQGHIIFDQPQARRSCREELNTQFGSEVLRSPLMIEITADGQHRFILDVFGAQVRLF
jgi:hypothetical protein